MNSARVALTDFHAKPGEIIDRSQAGPVTLTKRNRAYAVVVSADWFERAEEALRAHHGNRRVLVSDDLSAADRDFILANG
jgi:prevent-host-death family protein